MKLVLSCLFLFQIAAFISTGLIAGVFFFMKRKVKRHRCAVNKKQLLWLCVCAELLSQLVLFLICLLWFDFFQLPHWAYAFGLLSLLSLLGFIYQYHYVRKAADKELKELFEEETYHHIYE